MCVTGAVAIATALEKRNRACKAACVPTRSRAGGTGAQHATRAPQKKFTQRAAFPLRVSSQKDAKRAATAAQSAQKTPKASSAETVDPRIMSLPPHLRQYVAPTLHSDAQLTAEEQRSNAAQPPRPVSGPKPQYDWRRKNDRCDAVAVDANPGAIAWSDNGRRVEYVDQPQVKLQRTFGRDGKRLNVEGNTVHHPTGKQATPFPSNQADNFLRVMTGHDPHRRAPTAVMAPTLMPDCSLGPNGEWGDTRQLPGLSVESRAIDGLNAMNPDTLADGMLPFIRPDIHQWREQPVSYAAPISTVREPLIPDSRAGIFYKGNDIGTAPRFSEPIPALPGTPAAARRAESAEHMQLPRESNKESQARSVMTAPVPHMSLGSMARADQVPYEDAAHNMPGAARVAPRMLTAIRRYHKKLQQPHSHAYGAGIHVGDAAEGAYDGVRVDVSTVAQRAANRTAVAFREQPQAPLQFMTGVADGSGTNDYDFDVGSGQTPVRERDEARDLQRDNRAQNTLRTTAALQPGANDDSEDAMGGASRLVEPRDVRAASGERKHQKRSPFGVRLETSARYDDIGEIMDGKNAIGSVPLSNKHAQDDRRIEHRDFARATLTDVDASAVADSVRPAQARVSDAGRKDAQLQTLPNASAHMVAPAGDDGYGIGGSSAERIAAPSGGEWAQRQAHRAAKRAEAFGVQHSNARWQFDDGESAPGDACAVGVGHRLAEGSRSKRDSDVRSYADMARNAGSGVIELDSAAGGGVGTSAHLSAPSDARLALRDERADAWRGVDDQVGGASDSHTARVHGDAVRQPRSDGVPVDLSVAGYNSLDNVVELSAAQQRVASDAHRPQSWRREAGVVRDERRREYDSDAMTNLSRATVAAPGADRPHQRFVDREQRMTNDVRDRYAADEIHNIIGNSMLIDPEMVHLTRKHEAQNGRESSLSPKLRARMRAESPRPASHLERNSRFGRMLNASPSASPTPSRCASPCAALYK